MVNKNLLKVPLCLKWSAKVICLKNRVNIVSAPLLGGKNGNAIGITFDIALNDVNLMPKSKHDRLKSIAALTQIDARRLRTLFPI